jgi:hypothetical protein
MFLRSRSTAARSSRWNIHGAGQGRPLDKGRQSHPFRRLCDSSVCTAVNHEQRQADDTGLGECCSCPMSVGRDLSSAHFRPDDRCPCFGSTACQEAAGEPDPGDIVSMLDHAAIVETMALACEHSGPDLAQHSRKRNNVGGSGMPKSITPPPAWSVRLEPPGRRHSWTISVACADRSSGRCRISGA